MAFDKAGSFWIEDRPERKAKLTGYVKINGEDKKCGIFPNDKKEPGSKHPDFYLLLYPPKD
jgi:hypothetical protein